MEFVQVGEWVRILPAHHWRLRTIPQSTCLPRTPTSQVCPPGWQRHSPASAWKAPS